MKTDASIAGLIAEWGMLLSAWESASQKYAEALLARNVAMPRQTSAQELALDMAERERARAWSAFLATDRLLFQSDRDAWLSLNRGGEQ